MSASHRISVLDGFGVDENSPMGNTTTITAGHPPAQPSSSEVQKVRAVKALHAVKAALRGRTRRVVEAVKRRIAGRWERIREGSRGGSQGEEGVGEQLALTI
jgi:hypothetical protein